MRNVYVAVLTIAMWSGLLASPTGLYVPGPPSTTIPRFRARSTSDLAHCCEDGGISPGAPYDFGGASLLLSPIPNPPVAWQGCLQAPERLYFASMGHDAGGFVTGSHGQESCYRSRLVSRRLVSTPRAGTAVSEGTQPLGLTRYCPGESSSNQSKPLPPDGFWQRNFLYSAGGNQEWFHARQLWSAVVARHCA